MINVVLLSGGFVVSCQEDRPDDKDNYITDYTANRATKHQSHELRLEAYTKRSESNPGRSLGIIDLKRMAVWKTVLPTERSIR